jgi:hypothetical protein
VAELCGQEEQVEGKAEDGRFVDHTRSDHLCAQADADIAVGSKVIGHRLANREDLNGLRAGSLARSRKSERFELEPAALIIRHDKLVQSIRMHGVRGLKAY